MKEIMQVENEWKMLKILFVVQRISRVGSEVSYAELIWRLVTSSVNKIVSCSRTTKKGIYLEKKFMIF